MWEFDWESIKKAIELIEEEKIKRIDGDHFSAYAVTSNLIRIDLKYGDEK